MTVTLFYSLTSSADGFLIEDSKRNFQGKLFNKTLFLAPFSFPRYLNKYIPSSHLFITSMSFFHPFKFKASSSSLRLLFTNSYKKFNQGIRLKNLVISYVSVKSYSSIIEKVIRKKTYCLHPKPFRQEPPCSIPSTNLSPRTFHRPEVAQLNHLPDTTSCSE